MSLQNKKALMTWNSRLFIVLGAISAMILFSGCGQSTATNRANLATVTVIPAPKPTNTATPPLVNGVVTLRTDKTSYQPKDTISAILKNSSNQTIYFPDHLTDCSVILLQRLPVQPLSSDNGQAGVSLCTSKTVTKIHSLMAGQNLVVKLVAPSGGWPPGLYHAALTYTTTSRQPKSIYTTAFTIGPFAPQP